MKDVFDHIGLLFKDDIKLVFPVAMDAMNFVCPKTNLNALALQ